MKSLLHKKYYNDEAIKRLTLIKNWSDEAINTSSPVLSFNRLNTDSKPF
jgi:hypothetical protein